MEQIDDLGPWPWPNEHYVYLIGEPRAKLRGEKGFLKVGISRDPRDRLKSIQTSCPVKVEVILEWWLPTKAEARLAEREFHENYEPERTAGEWFWMNAGDAVTSIEVIIEPYVARFE